MVDYVMGLKADDPLILRHYLAPFGFFGLLLTQNGREILIGKKKENYYSVLFVFFFRVASPHTGRLP